MTIKYYGCNSGNSALIVSLVLADPYKRTSSNPSYCVWIVPGTVDCDGNSTLY
jgi:hypothetical protein